MLALKWRPLFHLADRAMEMLERFVWNIQRLGPGCFCRDYIEMSEHPQGVVFPAEGLPPLFPLRGGLTHGKHFLLQLNDSPDWGILFDPDSSTVAIAAQIFWSLVLRRPKSLDWFYSLAKPSPV